jgi:microcystin-dependent protein
MDPYIGELSTFAFDWAPRGWMPCNGQVLQISEQTALFSLIGTTYGGDGQSTFALPNITSAPGQGHVFIALEGVYPPRD